MMTQSFQAIPSPSSPSAVLRQEDNAMKALGVEKGDRVDPSADDSGGYVCNVGVCANRCHPLCGVWWPLI